MVITTYHDLAVFLADNPLARQQSRPEIPNCTNDASIVVIAGKTQQIDTGNLLGGPDESVGASWEIVFIGTINEFHEGFAMGISQQVDHGKARILGLRRSGSEFIRWLDSKTKSARPLTARGLRFLGIEVACWSLDDAQKLGLGNHQEQVQGDRFALVIENSTDAQTMIRYALTLKSIAQTTGFRYSFQTGLPSTARAGQTTASRTMSLAV